MPPGVFHMRDAGGDVCVDGAGGGVLEDEVTRRGGGEDAPEAGEVDPAVRRLVADEGRIVEPDAVGAWVGAVDMDRLDPVAKLLGESVDVFSVGQHVKVAGIEAEAEVRTHIEDAAEVLGAVEE